MFEAVIQFARTGNPNHGDIPEWKSCFKGKEEIMIFDKKCEVKTNHDHKLLDLQKTAFNFEKMTKFIMEQTEEVMLK